jgi:hypothetical protein
VEVPTLARQSEEKENHGDRGSSQPSAEEGLHMKQSERKETNKAAIGRRDLLRGLGAGAAVSAAPLADSAQAETWNEAEHQKTRYRLSDHIKAYYRVNRYPG